ncbi:hypothetical protein LWI29_016074 [Acer saccharum]|uniref:Protein kinase domain-containing protein n=1 Tax=Acer saccharum TaxID=4024 RepID=A0AA39RQG8_ACESA|nr:hypothetical protein LWI29_016074 [Acer saccharum]
MARIFGVDQTQGTTNRIVGTYGYMSPEYAMHGQFSVKSDVFSFGVLVLEIITGKKTTNFYQTDGAEDLLNYAWKHWRDGTPTQLLDSTLTDSYSRNEVIRCIHIGLLCVQEDPVARPTMATIVLMLNSYSVTLALPQQPAFFYGTRTDFGKQFTIGTDSDQSKSKSVPWSVDDSSITEAWKHWRDGTPMQLLDSNLTDSNSRNEVIRCIHVGLLCIQEDQATRPTIATVDLMLNSYSVTLPLPQQLAFFFGSRTEFSMQNTKETDSDQSTSKSMLWSIDDASITEVHPQRARKKYNSLPGKIDISTIESLQFDFGTIQAATNGFSTDNKLGEGGFGVVYKGVLSNGQEIAVKRLSRSSGQDGAEDLLNYAWKHWRDGTPTQLLDSTLTDSYSRNEVIRCIHIGLLCVQEDPVARPTMATVVLMLNSYSVTLALPQQPAFFYGTRTDISKQFTIGTDSDQSKSKSVQWSVDDSSITEVYPR